MEKPTSIPREKSGVLHSQMTTEGEENDDDFTIEDDLPTRRRASAPKIRSRDDDTSFERPKTYNSAPVNLIRGQKPSQQFSKLASRRRIRNISGDDDLMFEESLGVPKKKRNTNEGGKNFLQQPHFAFQSSNPSGRKPEHFSQPIISPSSTNTTNKVLEKKTDKNVISNIPGPPKILNQPSKLMGEPKTCESTTINVPASNLNISSSKISLVVKIGEKLLRVLVDKEATIDDLAKESAKRYFELHDKKPNLQLFDEVGAQLVPTDKVSAILDVTSSSLRLTSEVTSWIQTPIDQAYQIFCQKSDVFCYEDVQQKLSQSKVDGILDLSRMGLKEPKILEPVMKAIDTDGFIQDVRLSFCKLGNSFNSVLLSAITPPIAKKICVKNAKI